MTSRHRILTVLLLGILALAPVVSWAQGSPYSRQEWNDYQAAIAPEDPAARAQAIRDFMGKYPQSVLRFDLYQRLIGALYQGQRRADVLSAVEEFLALDMPASDYEKIQVNAAQQSLMEYRNHQTYVYVAREMITNRQQLSDAQKQAALKHARIGLEMLPKNIAAQTAAGANAAQLQQMREADELMYHQVQALILYQEREYGKVLTDLQYLLNKVPEDPNLNYQVGYSYLNKAQSEPLKAMWYLARAHNLNHPQKETIRNLLLREAVKYSNVVPSCLESDLEAMIARASGTLHPPLDWGMVTSEQIAAARGAITYAGLFEQLPQETPEAHTAWLAACGLPFGLAEDGQPTYDVVLFEVVEEPAEDGTTQVTLRVAATEEALTAKEANMEVVMTATEDLEALKAHVDQTVKIGGTISALKRDPFRLVIADAKVQIVEAEVVPGDR